jgi:CubicO group peptidase (beta-lactamase class C family)
MPRELLRKLPQIEKVLQWPGVEALIAVHSRPEVLRVLGARTRFGLGFGGDGGNVSHAGAGGSLGFADPPSGIALGYVMKQRGAALLIDSRASRLIDAVRESIG